MTTTERMSTLGSGLAESVSSWDPFVLPDAGILDVALHELYNRRAAVALRALSPAALEEVLVINNAVESVFLGLREAERFDDLTRLEHRRRAFYANPDDDRTFEQLLRSVRFEGPHEGARRELARQLRGKQRVEHPHPPAQRGGLPGVTADFRAGQRRLIDRLTTVPSEAPPSELYHGLVATIGSPKTRRKLAKAWAEVAAEHYARLADSLLAAKESAPDVRTPAGYRETMTTLRNFVRLAEQDRHEFLRTLTDRDTTQSETREAVQADLPHLVRTRIAARRPATYDIVNALSLVSGVADELLGLTITFVPLDRGLYSCRMESDGAHFTETRVDLNDRASKPYRSSYTQPIRNTATTKRWAVSAYSYISCRALPVEGAEAMSFQNILSLLHELGHAIQHAIPKHPLPSLSGLEGATSGRSESFSLWLEKGAFSLEGLGERHGLASLSGARAANAATQRLTAFSRGLYALIELAFDYGTRADLAALMENLDSLGSTYAKAEVAEAIGELADRFRDNSPGDNFRYIQAGIESASAITVSRDRLRDVGRILARRPWQPGNDVLGRPAEYFRFYRRF